MREQATRTERRSRKGIACAAVLACVLGAGCLAWGCTPAAAPSDGADKAADSTTTTEPAPATSDGYSDQLASISGFPTEGRFVDGVTALPGFYQNSEKNAANAEANEAASLHRAATGSPCSRCLPTIARSNILPERREPRLHLVPHA